MRRNNMRHLDFRDELPGDFDLFKWGDIHIGNIATSIGAIQKVCRKVKAVKNGYLSLMGDLSECIKVGDKRFSLAVHVGRKALLDAQVEELTDLFNPIGSKILYIGDGNHELKLANEFLINKWLAKNLDTIYAGTDISPCYLVKVLFPGFRLLDWHGYGSINSKSGDPLRRETNNLISLKRKLRELPGADCEALVSHHYHRLMIHKPQDSLELVSNPKTRELVQTYTEPRKIWIDKKNDLYRIPEEDKYYICCGSALRGYVEDACTYVEQRGYIATELGCIKISVRDDKIKNVEKVYL
jgi:hypothetical protein